MHIVPRMDRSARRELVRIGSKTHDFATVARFCAVALLGRGMCSPTVADILCIAVSTVVRAAHAYLAEGIEGLYDKRRRNGRRKVDDAVRARVTALVQGTPENVGWSGPTWTRELLCRQLEREGRTAVSVSTMGRALARIGARLGTPKPVVLCPWPRDERLARLDELRALEERASAAEPVLYADEADVHLNPKIGRDGCSPAPSGASSRRARTRSSTSLGRSTSGLEHKGAALFCALLRDLAEHYGPDVKRIHLIVDNYGIHSARVTQRTLEELGGRIVLHFLPPYCPDSNRIERVWQDLHANVTRNHRCKTMKALLGKARDYLYRYIWRRVAGVAPILQMAADQGVA